MLEIKHLGGRGRGIAVSLMPVYLPNEFWDSQGYIQRLLKKKKRAKYVRDSLNATVEKQ